jgi:UDP-glucose:(heptosyl)LPS alpha-1,3-glucosyltransferase
MKKKIAILLYKYFPYGGLQKDFLLITKELLSRNHDIKIFTRSWEGAVPIQLDVVQLGEKGFTNYSKNKNFVNEVFNKVQKYEPDIIFGFNKMPGLDLYFAADTCFAKQAKNKNRFQKYTRRFRQSINYENQIFSDKSESKILLLNQNQSRDFKEVYSTQEERMTIIPPGIDFEWNEVNSKNLHKLLNISKLDKLILFVGSDFYRKGLDRAIQGINHLKEKNISSSLIVIGDDDSKPFQASISRHSLQDKIFFMGPRSDVASFMKSADLLVHPAREEAAGNIIIEAMVSGLPSIVSKEVGFSDEVKKFNAGAVLPDNFMQVDFNNLLERTIKTNRLTFIKNNISSLHENNYFFSRSSFIADYIEENY